MNIQVKINGIWSQVSHQELLQMLNDGTIQPDTIIILNGMEVQAGTAKKQELPNSLEETRDTSSNEFETTNQVSADEMDDGDTPLHIAARNGNLKIIEVLLKCGDDPNVKNRAGQTPLTLAAQFGHHDVVSFLVKGQSTPTHPSPNANATHWTVNQPQRDFQQTTMSYAPAPLTAQQRKSRLSLWMKWYLVCFCIGSIAFFVFNLETSDPETAVIESPEEDVFLTVSFMIGLDFVIVSLAFYGGMVLPS